MKKKKILYIHHGIGIGGAPISLLNLIKKLDKDKFSIKVASLQGGEHIELFNNAGFEIDIIGAPRKYFSHTQTGRKQWYFLPYYLVVFIVWIYTAYYVAPKYLKKQQFDILHLNSHSLTSWAFAGKKMNKKVILHNREAITKGYLGIRYGVLKKLIKSNTDHIINISKDNQNRLGIYKNSSVVYNFIEIPEKYRKPPYRKKSKRKVLYLGGTAEIKGFSVVARCLQFLDNDIKVLIAGHIEKCPNIFSICFIKNIFKNKQHYLNIIEKHSNTTLIGRVKNPYKYIDDSDILISPFTIEHFSRPAIEAFAYGKAVIASNVEGMSEIIDHNVNGILVEKRSPELLASAINSLCNDFDKLIEFGELGRRKAIETFSPKPNIKKIEDIYNNIEI